MRIACLIGIGIAFSATYCAAQPDLAKLRDAMRLPVTSMNIMIKVFPPCGILNDPITSLEPEERVAALKRRLLGDNRDAATYLLLGAAYDNEEEDAKYEAAGKAAYTKAVELFHEQLVKAPGDGPIQSQLGSAYWGLTKFAEAEAWLRKAVKSAPNDGRCWANLGEFIQSDSLTKALGLTNKATYWITDPASQQGMLDMLKRGSGLNEKAKSLQAAETEARTAFETAVKLAPNDSDVFVRRYAFQVIDNLYTRNIMRASRGENPDYSYPLTKDAVADILQAADLRPDNARLQANALIGEVTLNASDITGGEFTTVDAKLAKLPAVSRESLKALLARILKLASSPDVGTATIASVAACTAYLTMADFTDATDMAERAVKLEPNNELAAVSLDMCLANSGKFAEMASALQKQIAHKDSALRRLWLAKAYEHQSKSADELEQVKIGLQAFPKDFPLKLAWAEVLMKQPDAVSLKHGGDALLRSSDLFDKLNDADQRANLTNYNYARGVYIALTGNTDEGRKALEEVLKENPGDKNARAALDALGK